MYHLTDGDRIKKCASFLPMLKNKSSMKSGGSARAFVSVSTICKIILYSYFASPLFSVFPTSQISLVFHPSSDFSDNRLLVFYFLQKHHWHHCIFTFLLFWHLTHRLTQTSHILNPCFCPHFISVTSSWVQEILRRVKHDKRGRGISVTELIR